MTLKHTYFAGISCNGVKTAKEAMSEGVNYCSLVNTSYKVFPQLHFKSCQKGGR